MKGLGYSYTSREVELDGYTLRLLYILTSMPFKTLLDESLMFLWIVAKELIFHFIFFLHFCMCIS